VAVGILMTQFPAHGTVRWYVSDYVRRHFDGVLLPVLEIGSKHEDHQWWRDLRGQLGVADELWTGLDMEPGPNVDVVCDITKPPWPGELFGAFGTVICSEVLEHVKDPGMALEALLNFVAPGGTLIVTVPFGFPVHNFPADYWRFTPDGLRLLLSNVGFKSITTEEMNFMTTLLCDHDSNPVERRIPLHVGACCRKP